MGKKLKKIIKKMNLYRKKICVISSSRAEYGLLKNLLCQIKKSKKLKLQLIVTGTHLSAKHGLTYQEIISDNLKIDKKIKILKNSDTSLAISNYLSDGIKKFSKTYFKIKPDLIFILGDKFEIFSAAIAAMLMRIPIGHAHGGETTEGAIDETIRHSITKMSHIHFVAAKNQFFSCKNLLLSTKIHLSVILTTFPFTILFCFISTISLS